MFKAAGIPVQGKPPVLRKVELYHLTWDQAPQTTLQYFQCYDPELRTFRVTLYDNLRAQRTDPRSLATVEVLVAQDESSPDDSKAGAIANELRQMGVFSGDANVISSSFEEIRAGFPVRTPELVAQTLAQAEHAESELDNVLLLGKSSGRAFFMNDVLLEVNEKVCARIR